MRRQKIGTMYVNDHLDITDPCYDRDVWCRMNAVPVQSGEYTCYVWRETFKDEFDGTPYTYRRVGVIGICLHGMIPPQRSMKRIGSIGVDAGLAGFFYDKPDFSDAEWHDFCEQIREGDAWLTDLGFFSSSGFGDGGYDVYATKVEDEIVALEIRFL